MFLPHLQHSLKKDKRHEFDEAEVRTRKAPLAPRRFTFPTPLTTPTFGYHRQSSSRSISRPRHHIITSYLCCCDLITRCLVQTEVAGDKADVTAEEVMHTEAVIERIREQVT